MNESEQNSKFITACTAFVAMDASRVTEGDHGLTVKVPVPVPEGVRYDTTIMERDGEHRGKSRGPEAR